MWSLFDTDVFLMLILKEEGKWQVKIANFTGALLSIVQYTFSEVPTGKHGRGSIFIGDCMIGWKVKNIYINLLEAVILLS